MGDGLRLTNRILSRAFALIAGYFTYREFGLTAGIIAAVIVWLSILILIGIVVGRRKAKEMIITPEEVRHHGDRV
ncbi:MAG: hypothetical protein R3C58_10135 [Parvularculaceae bacterium]